MSKPCVICGQDDDSVRPMVYRHTDVCAGRCDSKKREREAAGESIESFDELMARASRSPTVYRDRQRRTDTYRQLADEASSARAKKLFQAAAEEDLFPEGE